MISEFTAVAGAIAVVVAIIAAKRYGTAKAQGEANDAWRTLAEGRKEELADLRNRYELLLADVRAELDRLRTEADGLRDDKRQLAELNRHLMAENADMRQRIAGLETRVNCLMAEFRQRGV